MTARTASARPGAGQPVITGVGVVAPTGIGAQDHWSAVLAGSRRIGPISLFDASGYGTTVAGQVPDFNVDDHVESRLAVQTDRWTWLSFMATTEGFADARLDVATMDPYRISVALASSSGGNLFGQRELQRLWSQPSRTVGAYQSIAWFYAASVGQISIRHRLKGASCVLVSEAAGGLNSVAHAARTVRRGGGVVLAGGTEAPLSPYALSCQLRTGRLSGESDPDRAYRPFDESATGYVPGEGGAVLIVEDDRNARERGVADQAIEIAGWASTHDGTGEDNRGADRVRQYARAMRQALDRARVAPADVDLVFVDALGVPAADAAEVAALAEVFGPAGPSAVTTQKPLTGRLYQGGSALDVATAVLAMRQQVVPAAGGVPADVPGVRFVRESRPGRIGTALILARGFGGYNSALVLRHPTIGRAGTPSGRSEEAA